MAIKSRYDIVRQRNSDFLNTFAGQHGEPVLKYLSKYCMEKGSTFDKDSDRWTAFNEGKRSVILEIRHWLDMDMSKLEKD